MSTGVPDTERGVLHVADLTYYPCAPVGDPMNTMDVMYVNPVPSTVAGAYVLQMGGTPPAGTVS